jgi:hypothetical protein
MAYTERLATRTYISGAALTQFTFVVGPASDGQIDPVGTAGVRATGVALQSTTGAGQAVTVAYDGRVTVLAAGTIAAGAAVASNNAGRAVAATTGQIILGYAQEAGVSGQVITIDLARGETASA